MSTDDLRMDRRKFLGGAAGLAGAAAFASVGAWGIQPARRSQLPDRDQGDAGGQHFSVRDATARLDKSVMGYLGGPNFPEDPTDLGPLVPLPGGFAAVFEFLAECGYSGFEFFQLTQNAEHARRPPARRPPRSARWLDAAGMKSVGTHTGGLGMLPTPTHARDAQLRRIADDARAHA